VCSTTRRRALSACVLLLARRYAHPPIPTMSTRTDRISHFGAFEAVCCANSRAYHSQASNISTINTVNVNAPTDVNAPTAGISCNEPVTVFHTREHIEMSLSDIGTAMQRVTRCEFEALDAALVLCCRYSTCTVPVTRHMMHRLYVAALHVVLKAHSDEFLTNRAYAQGAGVTTKELARLERAVIHGVKWRCTVLLPVGVASLDSVVAEAIALTAQLEPRTALVHPPPRSPVLRVPEPQLSLPCPPRLAHSSFLPSDLSASVNSNANCHGRSQWEMLQSGVTRTPTNRHRSLSLLSAGTGDSPQGSTKLPTGNQALSTIDLSWHLLRIPRSLPAGTTGTGESPRSVSGFLPSIADLSTSQLA
jgi:hypothetical protein